MKPETFPKPIPIEKEITLSIVMPCLNEATTLGTCILKARAYLARQNFLGEIIVADNGSTDGSQQIAVSLGAQVVVVPERGYGNALKTGIQAARGMFVIMGDSDDSYNFESLDAFVEKLQAGYDLVLGNRFEGGIEYGAMPPLHRYLGNPLLTAIGRLLFKSPVNDFYCRLRGFRRDPILHLGLSSPGMEFALEMIVKSTINHLCIAEVPITLHPDGRGRPPHLRSWRDGWRSLRFYLSLSPGGLFLYPGLVLTALSGLMSIVLFYQYQSRLYHSRATYTDLYLCLDRHRYAIGVLLDCCQVHRHSEAVIVFHPNLQNGWELLYVLLLAAYW
jgi:glycosyltransferase involved in cell wall biosynthesis